MKTISGRRGVNRGRDVRDTRSRGFSLVEALVALGIILLLVGGLAVTQNAVARANENQLTRQRCLAAAEATLDALSATGQPLPSEQARRLWPEVALDVQSVPGAGQWQGLTLYTATARADSRTGAVQIVLRRYAGKEGG